MAEAWVTLATNDSYAVGVLVLAHSLRAAGSTRAIVVMVSDQVSNSMRERLSEVCSKIKVVNVLDSGDSANLAVLARPELGITFTKLHCWTLTEYSKCVFLDADTLVVRNCDELFERDELSAASDAGWPDCFNSGVFVFKPSLETYNKLVQFAVSQGSFDGGDQGLLNSYFKDWATKDISRHLPFIYNMTATAVYSYRPAYNQFGSEVRIVHFIGSTKPWQVPDSSSFRTSAPSEHVELWWNIFQKHVRPTLATTMHTPSAQEQSAPAVSTGVAAQFAQMDLAAEASATDVADGVNSEEQIRLRREAWERGEIDYKGKDSFDNIMEKIQNTIRRQSPTGP